MSIKASHPLPSDPETRHVRVLLADDSPRVRSELRQLLELAGAIQVVGEACDGLEAVRLAEELAPDAVVMDMEMPNLGGLDATRQVKERRLARRVVILSVYGDPEAQQRARQAGADDFVIKGASIETLVNAILGFKPSQTNHSKGD